MKKTILGLSMLAATVNAAELVIKDITIDFASITPSFDFDLSDKTNSFSGSDSFDNSYGLNLGYRQSITGAGDNKGLYLGAEITSGLYTFGSDGSMQTIGARGIVGFAWQYNDSFCLLSEGFGGMAIANMTFPDTATFASFDVDGTRVEYGGRLGAQYSINDTWSAKFLVSYDMIDADLSGGDMSLTLDQSGISFLLGVTWRWDSMPALLEY